MTAKKKKNADRFKLTPQYPGLRKLTKVDIRISSKRGSWAFKLLLVEQKGIFIDELLTSSIEE